MKEFWITVQVIFSAVGGWLGWFLGGCDGLLYALLAFVVIDYITGVMCAVVDKQLSSAVGFKGIFKKILIFALVGIGHILDTHVIGTGSVLRTAIIFFYLSNEGVSLIENAAYLGLPVPKKLKAVLEQLHNRAEKEADTEIDETETEDSKPCDARYPFSGMIVCGKCGRHYRRKTTQTGIVWICSTYNTQGKAACPSKQIPEEKLAGLLSDLDNSDVQELVAEGENTIRIRFKEGGEELRTWQDRSRSESWTDEKRASARKKRLERSDMNG